MSAPNRPGRVLAAFAVGALLALGCASTPKPPPAAARPPATEPAAAEAAPAAPAAPAAKADGRETRPPTLVVIDPGGEAPQTLAEAAKAERERRRTSTRKPLVVITDKNLAEYARQGEVTMAHPAEPQPSADDGGAEPAGTPGTGAPAGSAPAAGAPASGTPSPPGDAGDKEGDENGGSADADGSDLGDAGVDVPRDETFWRDRARGARTRWHQATEQVTELEKKAGDLRWRFYAEDDPAVRDQQIKPEWDRVLDDLRRARQDVRVFQNEVSELMEEGRRAGALPGWLREGIELEPAPPPHDRNPLEPKEPTDSIEPPVIKDRPQ